MEQKIFSVAVDGPSGAGKSTLAKAVAGELGIVYVDTGAIYRTIGYYVYGKGIDPKDAPAVIAILPELDIQMRYGEDGVQRMILNGEDVSTQIRLPEMSMYASAVSAIPEVRTFLLEMQRDMARRTSVIMDGRDIGTVVLPEAQVKLFLTAKPEERARRRYNELVGKGEAVEYENILRDIIARDQNDSQRETAPLRPAEDAIVVDTTEFGVDEVCRKLLDLIKEKLSQ